MWIVGGLTFLWGSFGAYDYLMTRTRNLDYIASAMPGVDPRVALAWVDAMPLYAQIGWGMGVWLGLLGAVLLLRRVRANASVLVIYGWMIAAFISIAINGSRSCSDTAFILVTSTNVITAPSILSSVVR